MACSVGYKKYLRLSKKYSYSNYNQFSIKSFLGINADYYDRYLIRMLEMAESLNVINLVSNYLLHNKINKNLIYQQLFNKNFNLKTNNYSYMEDLIEHFIHWHTGITIKKNITFNYIESPKGEFGTILVSNGSNKPKKCKIRSPSYFNLQFLPQLTKGHFLADLSALIGTVDIVFGEIDR